MKNFPFCYFLAFLLTITGCSSSKRSFGKNNLEKNKKLLIHITTKSNENGKIQDLIDQRFVEMEKLDLPFAKIQYNKKDGVLHNNEIIILFDKLTITNKENIRNKHFSKKVSEQQSQSDDGPTIHSVTVNGYVHQREKERKLNWDIKLNVNSDSTILRIKDNSWTENIISKSINNTISGDERAISNKYKESLGANLSSRQNMIEAAINNVYKKLEVQLRRNH
jgi:hypothetical protein